MSLIPKTRPKMSMTEVAELVKDHLQAAGNPECYLVGVRGYYSKSMGPTPGNDINLYDDAMFVVCGDTMTSFNANTDPSFLKGKAVLMIGRYQFAKGRHKNKYNALRAYPEGVKWPCTRDGKITVCQYINIHKGGMTASSYGVTWSEGCQTIPKTQWTEFINLVYSIMNKRGMSTIDYFLVNA